MGRQNICFLYGRVIKKPIIKVNAETGEYLYGLAYLDTIRGVRPIDDGVDYAKHDNPLVLSRDKVILDQMVNWEENSIVFVKGVLTTKAMTKKSHCQHCSAENKTTGNFVYVTPIHVRLEKQFETKKEAVKDVLENREISNQIYILGTLLKDPKLITTKRGVQISQYPIAINRKYIIRTDDPSIRTDWPIVKSYGDQAREDKLYLQYQADVIIDGFLQARSTYRTCTCEECGQLYKWKDESLELVPYDIEYVKGFKSKEEVEGEAQETVDALKQRLFRSGFKDDLEEGLETSDIVD